MPPFSTSTMIRPFLVLLIALGFSLQSFANDPSIGRQEAMDQISEDDIAKQTLRWKIAQSRMLILRMTDILPTKGNPYFHMADFATKVTLRAFNDAMNTTSIFMNSENPKYWLPVAESATLNADSMNDPQIAPVIKYFAQYVAVAEIMENSIQPILEKSIIIGSVAQTAGAEVDIKFKRAWRYIKHYSGRYKALLTSHSEIAAEMAKQKKQVTLMILGALVKEMSPHLVQVKSSSNEEAIKSFMNRLTQIAGQQIDKQEIENVKSEIIDLSNTESTQYQVVAGALESVDLPDTGEIDGADEAFEIAMRLEVGFDVIQKLMSEIKETW